MQGHNKNINKINLDWTSFNCQITQELERNQNEKFKRDTSVVKHYTSKWIELYKSCFKGLLFLSVYIRK